MEPTAIVKKEKSLQPKIPLSESGRQFREIFETFYSEDERAKRKILETRKKRAENIIKEYGL